jgi:FAD dependent oxidoreductase TIGR03364
LTGADSSATVPPVQLGASPDAPVDLVVVGAGIVGLAHAVDAARRGLSVVVLERDDRAVGASVQNFGHGCVTGQTGRAAAYADTARSTWLRLAKDAGFWLAETGAVVAARHDDELAVVTELADRRPGDVRLLSRAELLDVIPLTAADVVGGAHFTRDIRVDPRGAVGAIAGWLDGEPGVEVRFATNVVGVEPGSARTATGLIHGRSIVVCLGHDVDRLFPAIAADAGVQRCSLHMLAVAAPGAARYEPAVLSGLSLLRYPAFAACRAAADVRARLQVQAPELLAAGMNLMFTQRPNGDVLIGDTHSYERTATPFRDEATDELVLRETARLLGVARLVVRQRWRGVYAAAADDFLVAAPLPGVRVVSVTTGIGMTTAFGLAADVLDDLLS